MMGSRVYGSNTCYSLVVTRTNILNFSTYWENSSSCLIRGMTLLCHLFLLRVLMLRCSSVIRHSCRSPMNEGVGVVVCESDIVDKISDGVKYVCNKYIATFILLLEVLNVTSLSHRYRSYTPSG